MNLRKIASSLIETVLQNVYKSSGETEKKVEEILAALLKEGMPQLVEKITEQEKEIKNLRAALGYTYNPDSEEYLSFDEHSRTLWNAGSRPPDEDEYWADVALMHYEASKRRGS